jgi:hypothetical protein
MGGGQALGIGSYDVCAVTWFSIANRAFQATPIFKLPVHAANGLDCSSKQQSSRHRACRYAGYYARVQMHLILHRIQRCCASTPVSRRLLSSGRLPGNGRKQEETAGKVAADG